MSKDNTDNKNQVKENTPKSKKSSYSKKKKNKRFLISDSIKDIIKLDEKYRKNLVRQNTDFPMSFSISASKSK